MVREVADMRIDRLKRTSADLPNLAETDAKNVQKGLASLISQFDQTFHFAKGHFAHFLIVVDMLKSAGGKLKGIELRDVARELANGFTLLERRIDIVVEINGKTYYWEVKAFPAETWRDGVTGMMALTTRTLADGQKILEPGQLLSDLGKMYNEYVENGVLTNIRQLVLTPAVIGGRVKPTVKQFEDMENAVREHIVNIINDPKQNESLARTLNLDRVKVADGDRVELRKLENARKVLVKLVQGGEVSPIPEGLVKVYRFDNFVPPSG